jgi:hypothetical protein
LWGNAPFGHDFGFQLASGGNGYWVLDGSDLTTKQLIYDYATNGNPQVNVGFATGYNAISTEINNSSPTQVADGSTTSADYGTSTNASGEPGSGIFSAPWAVCLTTLCSGSVSTVASGTSQVTPFPTTNPGTTGSAGTWNVGDSWNPPEYFKHNP